MQETGQVPKESNENHRHKEETQCKDLNEICQMWKHRQKVQQRKRQHEERNKVRSRKVPCTSVSICSNMYVLLQPQRNVFNLLVHGTHKLEKTIFLVKYQRLTLYKCF